MHSGTQQTKTKYIRTFHTTPILFQGQSFYQDLRALASLTISPVLLPPLPASLRELSHTILCSVKGMPRRDTGALS